MKKPLLSDLTLREKIGQTAMGRPANKEYLDPVNYPYGHIWALGNIDMGVINMADKAQGKKSSLNTWLTFVENFSKQLKVPMLQAMDCTQGIENYFYETEPFIDPVTIGAAGGADLAYEAGQLKARLIKCVGSKWLWCPEVDLSGRRSTVMLGRQYSDDPQKLTEMCVADIKGIQSQRVAGCVKHFPGSDSLEYRDPHVTQTALFCTMDKWWEKQGQIFREMFDAGVDTVMISHEAFPAYDNTMINGKYLPSTTSRRILMDLLRGEMGYKGLIISDAIGMRALVNMYGGDMNRVYIECINAGIDVILGVGDGYFDAIEQAVLDGEIPMSRIDDACQRVLDLKEKLGLFEEDSKYASDELEQVSADIRDFKARVCKKAVSLVCNKKQFLPVKQDEIKNVAIIYSGHDEKNDGKAYDQLENLIESFEKRGAKVHMQRRLTSYTEMKKLAEENDLIIHAGYLMRNIPEGPSGFFGDEMLTFHYALDSGEDKTVGLGLGSPFMYFDFFSSYPTFINAYYPCKEMLEAVTAAIYGEIPFEGSHPFKLIPAEIEERMKKIGMQM